MLKLCLSQIVMYGGTVREVSNTTLMEKQKPSDIPDLLVYYDRYELCAVEANKKKHNDTEVKQDKSKLSITCLQTVAPLLHLLYDMNW